VYVDPARAGDTAAVDTFHHLAAALDAGKVAEDGLDAAGGAVDVFDNGYGGYG
jgi:hypothetical protein